MSAQETWAPEPNSTCRVEPRDEAISPDGVWLVLAHGPSAPTAWWLIPADREAHQWVDTHPRETTSRCVEVRGNRLRPVHTYTR